MRLRSPKIDYVLLSQPQTENQWGDRAKDFYLGVTSYYPQFQERSPILQLNLDNKAEVIFQHDVISRLVLYNSNQITLVVDFCV